MKEIIKKYKNDSLTIVWKPGLCIHSTKCWKGEHGLLAVFNPSEKPWIKPFGASTESIIAQIKTCPSGALSFFINENV
ncbi:MAG: (4Fe-4S)-binding protein [Saprospiraceae bacterium]|nr:(4Fe-4S)-binding protein [Saprospiraceae bacterium]